MHLWQTVKTHMKCRIMWHFIRVYIVCLDKKVFRERNLILFGNLNLWPLKLFNGPSQVYCIKPEGRIHQGQRVKHSIY